MANLFDTFWMAILGADGVVTCRGQTCDCFVMCMRVAGWPPARLPSPMVGCTRRERERRKVQHKTINRSATPSRISIRCCGGGGDGFPQLARPVRYQGERVGRTGGHPQLDLRRFPGLPADSVFSTCIIASLSQPLPLPKPLTLGSSPLGTPHPHGPWEGSSAHTSITIWKAQ